MRRGSDLQGGQSGGQVSIGKYGVKPVVNLETINEEESNDFYNPTEEDESQSSSANSNTNNNPAQKTEDVFII